MKKNTKILFLTTIIAVILLYLVSAIFTLGTAFAPATALEVRSINPNREQTHNNAFAVVDLVRTRQDTETQEKYTANISEIYVFVGEVRSYAMDEQGNPYVELFFHFKTTGDDSSFYNESISAKIPVRELSGGYEWIKVFDAQTESEEVSYNRVKISTPDCIDIYEVVFTDATGYVFPASAKFGTEEQKANASLLIDEQNTFVYSTSKKYHFTDRELKTVSAVNALRGGKLAVGESGPFSTILYFISTSSPLGLTTFTLRFFDLLAGLGLIILAFAFAKTLFGEEKYGLMSLLAVLSLGAVFTASNFAVSLIGTFFAVLSLLISSRYFINHYSLSDMTEGLFCLLGVGLFYGLAIACSPAYALTGIGHIVLFTMARKRAYKKFKRDEKEAVGLQKEEVFLAYRKRNVASFGIMAISLIVLPAILFIISYTACAPVYKAYYGVGFMKGASKCFFAGLKPAYVSSPFALFVGFGGAKLNSYYSFLNYFTCIFALLCFIFVTFVVFFGKKFAFFSKVEVVKNKYKIVTVAFLSLCLPIFFGLTSSPYGFAGVSVFMCAYVAFAHCILVKCVKENIVNLAFSVATILGLLIFGMAYVGYVGLAIPEVAKSILYYWQVL